MFSLYFVQYVLLLPATERIRLLAVLVRLADRNRRIPDPQGAASFGWTAYAPLSNTDFSPGVGGDLWVLGLGISGFGTILGAVNFITANIGYALYLAQLRIAATLFVQGRWRVSLVYEAK